MQASPRGVMGFTIIGYGATGLVCRCEDENGVHAVKFTYLDAYVQSAKNQQAFNELEIIRRLRSPFVVYFQQSQMTRPGFDPAVLTIVLEYANAGNLQSFVECHLAYRLQLDLSFCGGIAADLVAGLLYLRSEGVMHRDIKPANVLLFRNGSEFHAKIADFGIALIQRRGHGGADQAVGTLLTAAPEVLRGERYDERADLWSLGVVFYFMLSGRFPYSGQTAEQMLQAFGQERAPLASYVPEYLARLVDGLLIENFRSRISLREIVACGAFREMMNQRFQPQMVEYLVEWSQ